MHYIYTELLNITSLIMNYQEFHTLQELQPGSTILIGNICDAGFQAKFSSIIL